MKRTKELEKELSEILKIRGLDEREYQIRNILDYINPEKPHVYAAGTAAGKTITTSGKFELYYKCGIIKPNEKVLILSADKTILRGNFKKQFDGFNPTSLTYCAVEDKVGLIEAVENDVQVIIGLPQLIKDNTKLLKNIKWLVVDEAHNWYFESTIQNIIKDLKPKYQFLLTGTPFKFNLRKSSFIIDYTSVSTLYKQGYVSDVNMQVLHTSLSLTRMDWHLMTGNLREDKVFTKKEINDSLSQMIYELVKKLKLPIKGLSSFHNVTKNVASKVFGKLQKTIIFTHRTDAADVVAEYLKLHGVNCIVSHSNIDGEIAEKSFDKFRSDNDIKVLVTVNRGKEGFDFPELYNIIDMTYSQNFAVVMQMIGRLLRPSKNKTYKVFYKVAPKHTASYFTEWMDCLIQLFDDYGYQNFNTKNTNDIRVPNALLNRPKAEKEPVFIQDGKKKIQIAGGTSLTKGTKIQIVENNKKVPLKDGTYKVPQAPTTENPKPKPIEIEVKNGVVVKTPIRTTRGTFRPKFLDKMGFDLSLSFMEKNDWFRLEDPLSTVATTSLYKIMMKHGFKSRVKEYSKKELIEYINSCETHDELINKNNRIYRHIITNKKNGCYELVIDHLTIHKVPFKWLSTEDKMKKIEFDRNTCSHFAEFNKKFQSHSIYLSKLYKPKTSEEGKKKYDEFFSSLIKTKTERTFEDIILCAEKCENFRDFQNKYPIEYDYCTRAGRKWILPLRAEMEKRIKGWDNGQKSPKRITSTPEGIKEIKRKYKELGNHLSKTAEYFNISLTATKTALKK